MHGDLAPTVSEIAQHEEPPTLMTAEALRPLASGGGQDELLRDLQICSNVSSAYVEPFDDRA